MAPNGNESCNSTRRFLLAGLGAGCLTLASAGPSHATSAAQAEPDGIGTVWWVELVTADDERAAGYYAAILAWDSKRTALADGTRAPEPGEATYTLFSANGSEVAGALKAEAGALGKSKPMWIVYFRVESVDKAIDAALKQGGELLMQPFEAPGVRMAVLADPDGTAFGVAAPSAT